MRLLSNSPTIGYLRLPESTFPFHEKVEIFINCADPESSRFVVDSGLMEDCPDHGLLSDTLRRLADALDQRVRGPAIIEGGVMMPLRSDS